MKYKEFNKLVDIDNILNKYKDLCFNNVNLEVIKKDPEKVIKLLKIRGNLETYRLGICLSDILRKTIDS